MALVCDEFEIVDCVDSSDILLRLELEHAIEFLVVFMVVAVARLVPKHGSLNGSPESAVLKGGLDVDNMVPVLFFIFAFFIAQADLDFADLVVLKAFVAVLYEFPLIQIILWLFLIRVA